jgi:iron complex transport system ATP-binding protein
MKTLDINKLDFSYGPKKILNHVDLEINDGELVCIVGENGAGKSTLIKIINRINNINSGSIKFQNRLIQEIPARELSRLIGYVPQSVHVNFPATVFDVILLGRIPHIAWKVGKKDRRIVSKTVMELNLQHIAFRPFDQLSGGERQKVLIARALVQEPRLILLDEPTSNLDLRHQLEVMETIRRAVKEGDNVAAVIAIHDLNLASKFADRIAFMHQGKIEDIGKPSKVITPDIISRVYGIKADVTCKTKGDCVVVVPLQLINKKNKNDEKKNEKF